MTTTIRACQPKDVDHVASLAVGMGRAGAAFAIAQRMRAIQPRPDHRLCVAEWDGTVVGYAWAQNHGPHLRTGESIIRIHDVFVQPDKRRNGIGRALFSDVRDWAAEQGAHYLQWQASQDALPFYGALGLAGDPCPDPGHPFFEVVLRSNVDRELPD